MKRLSDETVAMKLPHLPKVWEFTASHWEAQLANEAKRNGTRDRWQALDPSVVIGDDNLLYRMEEGDDRKEEETVFLKPTHDGIAEPGERTVRETEGRAEGRKGRKKKGK